MGSHPFSCSGSFPCLLCLLPIRHQTFPALLHRPLLPRLRNQPGGKQLEQLQSCWDCFWQSSERGDDPGRGDRRLLAGWQHIPGAQRGKPELRKSSPPVPTPLGARDPSLWSMRRTNVSSPCPRLTSPVGFPAVVLPSEGHVVELGALQLSEVLRARRAVLWSHSQRSVRGWAGQEGRGCSRHCQQPLGDRDSSPDNGALPAAPRGQGQQP